MEDQKLSALKELEKRNAEGKEKVREKLVLTYRHLQHS